jgi:hypothetical protein
MPGWNEKTYSSQSHILWLFLATINTSSLDHMELSPSLITIPGMKIYS